MNDYSKEKRGKNVLLYSVVVLLTLGLAWQGICIHKIRQQMCEHNQHLKELYAKERSFRKALNGLLEANRGKGNLDATHEDEMSPNRDSFLQFKAAITKGINQAFQ